MRWVIFRSNLDYVRFMFSPQTNPDVLFDCDVSNQLLHRIARFHRSVKLNCKLNMPLKSIWYRYYLDYDALSPNDEIVFIFFEGCQMSIDKNFLKYLKKRYPRSKFVYRYFNTITDYNKWSVPIVTAMYDLIVSIDSADCKTNGWVYVPNTYPINVDSKKYFDKEYQSDVFFIGREKGRLAELVRVYDYLTKQGINALFIISGLSEPDVCKNREGIRAVDLLPYQEVLKYVASTRCLLEIVQKQQRGSTLRALEAIGFDKLLISNELTLEQTRYYNPKYMKIYRDISEIDPAFILTDFKVSYNDKTIISNQQLFDQIKQSLQ